MCGEEVLAPCGRRSLPALPSLHCAGGGPHVVHGRSPHDAGRDLPHGAGTSYSHHAGGPHTMRGETSHTVWGPPTHIVREVPPRIVWGPPRTAREGPNTMWEPPPRMHRASTYSVHHAGSPRTMWGPPCTVRGGPPRTQCWHGSPRTMQGPPPTVWGWCSDLPPHRAGNARREVTAPSPHAPRTMWGGPRTVQAPHHRERSLHPYLIDTHTTEWMHSFLVVFFHSASLCFL